MTDETPSNAHDEQSEGQVSDVDSPTTKSQAEIDGIAALSANDTANDVYEPNGMSAQRRLAWLGAIENPEKRNIALNLWLRDMDGSIVSLASRIRIGLRLDHSYTDDIAQMARLVIVTMVDEAVSGKKNPLDIQNFLSMLTTRVERKTHEWMNSTEGLNSMTEVSGHVRRTQELNKVRDELHAKNGVEPSNQEVLDAANAKMEAQRANPKKQGMQFREEHLAHQIPRGEDIDLHATNPRLSSSHDANSVEISPSERVEALLLLIARCDEESPLLGKVARVWATPALSDDYDEEPSAAHIARVLGIKAPTARRERIRVRAIMREIVFARFGITGVHESIDVNEVQNMLDDYNAMQSGEDIDEAGEGHA